ncbi:hypothetical protein HHI36_022952 [Cryptolaemus montrouzieri]|uniref:Uncharacterized protein n=1 Tax=Cryptolaemus montrouzieri TaxID=559131 RepID=A0ABD2PGG9_9CUCU
MKFCKPEILLSSEMLALEQDFYLKELELHEKIVAEFKVLLHSKTRQRYASKNLLLDNMTNRAFDFNTQRYMDDFLKLALDDDGDPMQTEDLGQESIMASGDELGVNEMIRLLNLRTITIMKFVLLKKKCKDKKSAWSHRSS